MKMFAVPMGVKTTLYFFWFRYKQYKASLLTCFLLAALPMIGLGVIGLPVFLGWVGGIGIAVYVLSQNTNAPVVPWGVVTIVSVEIIYALLERLVLTPIFY